MRKNPNLSFEHLVSAPGQAVLPLHHHPSHLQRLRARGPDQVCLLRAMKGFGFHPVIIVWGDLSISIYLILRWGYFFFTLSLSLAPSLYLSHSIPVSFSFTLSGMLPVSLIAGVWFSLPPLWFHLSGRFFLPCSKEKHKTHGGRCSPSLSSSLLLSLSLMFILYILHSLIVLWLCNSWNSMVPLNVSQWYTVWLDWYTWFF